MAWMAGQAPSDRQPLGSRGAQDPPTVRHAGTEGRPRRHPGARIARLPGHQNRRIPCGGSSVTCCSADPAANRTGN